MRHSTTKRALLAVIGVLVASLLLTPILAAVFDLSAGDAAGVAAIGVIGARLIFMAQQRLLSDDESSAS